MCSRRTRRGGFSLTEVLLAVATVAVGMLFIGGAFMVGVYYAAFSTEQTLGAIIAREAVGTLQARGIGGNIRADGHCVLMQDRYGLAIAPDQRLYPSLDGLERGQGRYCWHILYRSDPLDPCSVLVTVFVCRLTSASYHTPAGQTGLPEPIQIRFDRSGQGLSPDQRGVVCDGTLLVRDRDGRICRARRVSSGAGEAFLLEPARDPDMSGLYWVISPAADGGRDPTLAAYQTRVALGALGGAQQASSGQDRIAGVWIR